LPKSMSFAVASIVCWTLPSRFTSNCRRPDMTPKGAFSLVFLELVPRDVSRKTVPNQYATAIVRVERATRLRPRINVRRCVGLAKKSGWAPIRPADHARCRSSGGGRHAAVALWDGLAFKGESAVEGGTADDVSADP
jgi:hypothetical protein